MRERSTGLELLAVLAGVFAGGGGVFLLSALSGLQPDASSAMVLGALAQLVVGGAVMIWAHRKAAMQRAHRVRLGKAIRPPNKRMQPTAPSILSGPGAVWAWLF